MPEAAARLARLVLRAAVAGLALGAAEVALALLRAGDLFLDGHERQSFVVAALAGSVSICVLIACGVTAGARLLHVETGRRVQLAASALAWPFATWALYLLTSGRRVRDLPARYWLCALAAAVGSIALGRLVRALGDSAQSRGRGKRWLHSAWLATWTLGVLLADAFVLSRLYPAFHVSLAALAILGALASSWLAPSPALPRSPPPLAANLLAVAALALAFWAPWLARDLAAAPNARFTVEETAPLTGKLLQLFGGGSEQTFAREQPSTTRSHALHNASQGQLDLRGQDVLLISVDALRADRTGACGGRGKTPEIDALAGDSVVFTHAYTPTPHTSYAVGSLFTGKYLRPVMSLPNPPRDHATLPRMLRRFGYRTAGFYPPAIFFVDQERFAALHADRFGFEYTKEMFAPAATRVQQVASYLDHIEPGHPVFVWVHLFEPHEPYEPPPERRHGERPIDLYDAEVATADAAVGDLVRAFRARRPYSTVIVTADHGEEFGEHGGYHHGTALYEEQVHVPLLWSSSGSPPTHGNLGDFDTPTIGKTPARVVAAPVELIDISTTLLAALGVPRDARMRGDDLSGLLAATGALQDTSDLRAFASIDELRMLSDGRYKALCDVRASQCRGFDLQADPSEKHPLPANAPQLAKLRAELASLVADLPRAEAAAMEGGGGWPAALSRARLGDASVGPEILPLLGSERSDVRAEAVRAVARLHLAEARQVIATLRAQDADPAVRAEAQLCAFELGEADAASDVKALLARAAGAGASALDLARRAALALAARGEGEGAPVLVAWAADADAEEAQRAAALAALGKLGAESAQPALIELLDDVRMRGDVVRALAAIGGWRSSDAIARAFASERYPEWREAEGQALVQLRDPRAVRLLTRFLGTDSGVPNGVQHLLDAGALAHAGGLGADLRKPESAWTHSGEWTCDATAGCAPGQGAELQLRAPGAARRIVVRAHASGAKDQWLAVAGEPHPLPEGESETSWLVAAERSVPVRAAPGVQVIAFSVVPVTEDIAPPPPEPYDAGVDSGAAAAADLR